MFCVIQKVTNKKPNPYGASKELISDRYSVTIGGVTTSKYTYRYSEERFERPVLDAYKIVIHHSYREDGKVKKRQWVICTMSYYTLLDSGPWDCIYTGRLREKLSEMEIEESVLWDMVCEKLDPIIEKVKAEFQLTEEYRANQKHKRILDQYRLRKKSFEDEYGPDTYERCYDVYGDLKNAEYLVELQEALRQKQEYQERSYRSNQQSNYDYSYSEFFKSGSGYSNATQGNYTNDEKAGLKKIFRHLSKTFHPDISKDDGEMMKLINKLREGWGI